MKTTWPTPFQARVYRELARVPRGSLVTYGELARRVASSPRAVGGAVAANERPDLYP